MYIIKCETDRQSRLGSWDKCSGLVHWDDSEGWDGEGGGRGVQDGEHVNPWLIHVHVWQKPLHYCKVIRLQLIKISEKQRKRKTKLYDITLVELKKNKWTNKAKQKHIHRYREQIGCYQRQRGLQIGWNEWRGQTVVMDGN